MSRCLDRKREELKVLERDTTLLERIVPPFPRLSYDEAVQKVTAAGVEMKADADFGSPQEDAVARDLDRPVIIHRFPTSIKSFYMQPDPERPDRALCMDMIAPEGYGEIIGGSHASRSAASVSSE